MVKHNVMLREEEIKEAEFLFKIGTKNGEASRMFVYVEKLFKY